MLDSQTKFNGLCATISQRGNSSNIPGLSVPGATAATASVATAAAVGYPSMGGGGGAAAASFPSTTSNSYGAVTSNISSAASSVAGRGTAAAVGSQFFSYGQVPISGGREYH